ncbi:MAG: hypothetical protein Q9166_003753 [cf. Caloplaca sp. 2 TL-2023]
MYLYTHGRTRRPIGEALDRINLVPDQIRVGIGGFLTAGLENVWDWKDRSILFLSPNHPGTMAEKVLGFTRMLYDGEDNEPHKTWYWHLAEKLEAKVAEMSPDREDVEWWAPVASGRKNEMKYRYVNSVDGPAEVDCATLQHQGLGQGTLDLNAGETKYFNQETCALRV